MGVRYSDHVGSWIPSARTIYTGSATFPVMNWKKGILRALCDKFLSSLGKNSLPKPIWHGPVERKRFTELKKNTAS